MRADDTYTIAGKVCIGREFELAYAEIEVENGIIKSITETGSTGNAAEKWIFPCFFNAHTHLGDTVAMDIHTKPGMTLSDLVAPPNGLKHRILSETPSGTLTDAMTQSLKFMKRSATAGFCDFREGGAEGVNALKTALDNSGTGLKALILGRNGGESVADGIGISSTKEGEQVLEYAAETKKRGGFVAFHAGEKDTRDIDAAIDAQPDLLIHMTHATDSQLRRCAESEIPIAVCPRSNHILGQSTSNEHPPIRKMLDLGCEVLLGTDNAMFVQPDMFAEMSFVSYAYGLTPDEILNMAVAGSKLINSPFFIEEGNIAAFFTINPETSNLRFSRSPKKSVVNRGVIPEY